MAIDTSTVTLEQCVAIVDNLLGYPNPLDCLRVTQATALSVAATYMAKRRDLHRETAIINYHVKYPAAVLMRDPYTLAALKAAKEVLEWEIRRTK